jgi:hypothetical protein
MLLLLIHFEHVLQQESLNTIHLVLCVLLLLLLLLREHWLLLLLTLHVQLLLLLLLLLAYVQLLFDVSQCLQLLQQLLLLWQQLRCINPRSDTTWLCCWWSLHQITCKHVLLLLLLPLLLLTQPWMLQSLLRLSCPARLLRKHIVSNCRVLLCCLGPDSLLQRGRGVVQ